MNDVEKNFFSPVTLKIEVTPKYSIQKIWEILIGSLCVNIDGKMFVKTNVRKIRVNRIQLKINQDFGHVVSRL